MSAYYSRVEKKLYRFLTMCVIVTILCSSIPAVVFAEDGIPPDVQPETTPVTEEQNASSTDSGTEDTQEIATTTEETSLPDGGTASSTDDGTSGGTGNSQDGADGSGGANDGNTATTTATSTPSQAPNGSEGADGSAGATPDDEVIPVEVISDGLLNDVDSPEEEENTGDIRRSGTNTLIETGIATAQGKLSTDANSNDIRSELGSVIPSDFDTYTFIATGTNDAIVTNDGLTRSTSGDNIATGRNTAKVHSGEAVSAFNLANVINTNVINSDGFIYLGNTILQEGQSLDLTSSFFPDPASERALGDSCSLLSCTAEDVVYNVSQMNHATITNNALIEATTGYNEANGDLSSEIVTGDAYAAANVINVVNSNIIDSNYRLFTYNAIGDLDGDLVLPTEELIDAFFSRPNGTNQVESFEDVHVNVNNSNDALVDNNLETYAETGINTSTTAFGSNIVSGRGESESNTLNKINENTYGGDSMYMLIRVHGLWSGDVVGLPSGLAWEWTPQGIVIYNIDAEISPSEFLGYDKDSYTANFTNNNRVVLQNNITINAITGENQIEGLIGSIQTGDAFASANVMNIANTNIIGTNWTFAVINILGDFDGNVSFAATDLLLTGNVTASKTIIGPEDILTFTYLVTNHGNSTATNVVLDQVLQFAQTNSNGDTQSVSLGTIAPGASKQAILTGKVKSDIPYGTTTVSAYASVGSDQGDLDVTDNLLMLSRNAFRAQTSSTGGTGTTTNNGTGTTTNNGTGGTGTTTNNGTGTNSTTTPPTYIPTPPSSGGGGGGNSTKKTKVERKEVKNIDPKKAPLLTIEKTAVNVDENEVVLAGESVDYEIIVSNGGGNAYDVEVFDVLTNPIGSIVNEQSWVLDTVLPGEVIKLAYTTEYNPNTPSGKYTNTARVVGYLKDGMKEAKEAPLKTRTTEHTIEIKGLDLAVGNVSVLAYFPGANGTVSALVAWETSKPSFSQIFYGQTATVSSYNPSAQNFGYKNASFKFPTPKPKHMMIITGLEPGRTHAYRIHAHIDSFKTTSREYTFTLPTTVARLMLPGATPAVAGAATSVPVPVAKYVPPAPPEPAVVPTPTTEPTSQAPQKQGGIGGFVKNVFGFFR